MFNALKYTEELEKAGFTRDQADVSVKVLIDVMNENFATKSDIKELDLKVDSAVQRLESKIDSSVQMLESKIDSSVQRLDSKIDSLGLKLNSRIDSVEGAMREMEYRLTIKLGTMITLAIGVTATVVKLISPGH